MKMSLSKKIIIKWWCDKFEFIAPHNEKEVMMRCFWNNTKIVIKTGNDTLINNKYINEKFSNREEVLKEIQDLINFKLNVYDPRRKYTITERCNSSEPFTYSYYK
jgi:hypothetical protein